MIGLVLALVGVLAIPLAAHAATSGTTDVNGTVPFSITVNAPQAIGLTFVLGQTSTGSSSAANAGSVTANGAWQVTAKDQNTTAGTKGYMLTPGGNKLGSKLQISKDNTTFADADAGIIYTDSNPVINGSLNFYVRQAIGANEQVGYYSITIVFTGSAVA